MFCYWPSDHLMVDQVARYFITHLLFLQEFGDFDAHRQHTKVDQCKIDQCMKISE